jgi:hypothetical protein
LQHFEDKIAAKFGSRSSKNVNFAGRRVLVRAVLTSPAIYHISSLDLPKEVLTYIRSLLRAYLWADCEKVSDGKCKANWEMVCRPTKIGNLGILNLDKFATAHRLRWLWHEWTDEIKAWIGLGNSCNKQDRESFFLCGDNLSILEMERKLSLGDGCRPKDIIAPKIYDLSTKKNCSSMKALQNNSWVNQVDLRQGFEVEHIQNFIALWEMVTKIDLTIRIKDTIT